jgi:hypothetical protein
MTQELTLEKLLDYLEGRKPIKGKWFTETPPKGEVGAFWWRKHLRPLIAQETRKAEVKLLQHIRERLNITIDDNIDPRLKELQNPQEETT